MEKSGNSTRRFYTIGEVARICKVARGTIDRWHRECPNFPRKIILGIGCARFDADEFDAWINSRQGRAQ